MIRTRQLFGKTTHRRLCAAVLSVLTLCFATLAHAEIDAKPPVSTFNSIGLTVDIAASDDANRNAQASVEYRRAGSGSFQPSIQLTRISATRFSGSIFSLSPGTRYDVRITFSDADNDPLDGQTIANAVTTRAEIRFPTATNSYIVAANGSGSTCNNASPCSISEALARVSAGEEIVMRGGTYYTGDLRPRRSGESGAPIVIRAVDGQSVTFDGGDAAALTWTSAGNGVYRTAARYDDIHLVVANNQRLLAYQSLADLTALRFEVSGSYTDGTNLYVKLSDSSNPSNANILVSRYSNAFIVEQDYIYFKGLRFRHYGRGAYAEAIYFNDANFNLVTDSEFFINDTAIAFKRASGNNVIQDNVFSDTIFSWPWDSLKSSGSDPMTEVGAVNFYSPTTGQGNVIRRNRVHDVFDGISSCPEQTGGVVNETDVYDNVIYRAADDGITTDGECGNVRIFGNTIHNSLVGISLAPAQVGPTYAIRNTIYNIGAGNNDYSGTAFKFNSGFGQSGTMYLFHNTVDAARASTSAVEVWSPGSWDNIVARNNIFSGRDFSIENHNSGQPTNLDYNGYYSTNSARLVRWNSVIYDNLTSFTQAINQEANGVQAAPGFVDASGADFTPGAGSSMIDAGFVMPGINDNFGGSAPDLGAIEVGATEPPDNTDPGFSAPPIILTQIQGQANETGNPPSTPSIPWLTVAVDNVTADNFDIALDRAEVAPGTITAPERVGYLAVEAGRSGSFTATRGEVGYASQRVNNIPGFADGCVFNRYINTYQSPPVVLASLNSRISDEGGWLRYCSRTANALSLTVDEDVFRDSERVHVKETAAMLSFGLPFKAQFSDINGPWLMEARAIRTLDTFGTPEFTKVRFLQPFQQPPLIFTLSNKQGSDPSAIRIRNVTTTDFELAQVEPSGNDGEHVAMTVHYVAITPGVHFLVDGTRLEAKELSLTNSQQGDGVTGNNSWKSVDFDDASNSVDQLPNPVFSLSPSTGVAPMTTSFNAQSSSDDVGISAYQWNFGDGATGNGVTVSHTYTQAGSYTARLTVTDTAGQSASSTRTVSVAPAVPTDEPPTARFTMTPRTGDSPLVVRFDATSSTDDNAVARYEWDFGDGTTGSGATVQHTYTGASNYTATLTVFDAANQRSQATGSVRVTEPQGPLTPTEAARFLTQATFGPTSETIASLQTQGINAWLERQFSIIGPPHRDYYYNVNHGYSGSRDMGRHEKFWIDIVEGEDQLRQRVAFALTQLFVVSDVGRPLNISQVGMAHYYDVMRNNAFGNYRSLLEQVTLNPIMATYLSSAGNSKEVVEDQIRPDENYAREVLQLFSVGLYEKNIDGTFKLDASGNKIPTYTEDTVKAFARVFTGWEVTGLAFWRQSNRTLNGVDPMIVYPEYHDTGSKRLLNGVVLPANQTTEKDLADALDNISNNPNVGPFIVKHLIQRLVTSTPTPAYVGRVARVFNNDGQGVRGNLRAVVRSILTDREARRGHVEVNGFGKLREPILRMSHMWRALRIQKGTANTHGEYDTFVPYLDGLNAAFGQALLSAPSVFNFYKPNFAPLGPVKDANLLGPEFQIATDNNVLATTNKMSRQVLSFYKGTTANNMRLSHLNIDREIALAANPGALLDHLNVLLMSGAMSPQMRSLLLDHMAAIPGDEEGLSQRARDVIALITASPDYLIQM